MSKNNKVPALPKFLRTKIYKTGQTRGADNDVIYQNRVSRKSTVLIPYKYWDEVNLSHNNEIDFESGYICLISPKDYFHTKDIEKKLAKKGLVLGVNTLVFYQLRSDWLKFPPKKQGWKPANSRNAPLLGQYVARIAATTSENGEKISQGFNTTKMKGAGIRLFEYATTKSIKDCQIQLEAIFWLCYDSIESTTKFSMSLEDAQLRRKYCFDIAKKNNLLDFKKLQESRVLNDKRQTICPLCLKRLSSYGFFNRLSQAIGRQVHDLTITEINLFHIKELRFGEYNHKAYNLGWGHHHCNVVVTDSGIDQTLKWMYEILERNQKYGYKL